MANPLAAFGNMILGGGNNAAQVANSVFEAVMNDDPQAVDRQLSKTGDLNTKDQDGWTPVQAACWGDKAKALGELLKHRPDLESQDAAGRTAVQLAAFKGSDRCLRRILHAGANPDTTDKNGLSALHKAAVTGELPCMRTLLEYRANVSLSTPDGLTAAHLAAWKGQREALRLLHSHRADLDARAADGGTPLHEAVRSGDMGTVELLLQLKVAPGLPDKFGRRPQDIAFEAGDRQLFRMLHEATAKAAQPDEPSDLPEPSDFWKYVNGGGGGGWGSSVDEQESGIRPPERTAPQQQGQQEPHPREEFEKWLGGILFPQRARKVEARKAAEAANEGAPYARYSEPEAPRHTVGHAGGSQFAAKRAEQEQQRKEAQQNVKTTLDPYEAPSAQQTQQGAADPYTGQKQGGGGLMGFIGAKARRDMQAAQGAIGQFAKNFAEQNQKSTGTGGNYQVASKDPKDQPPPGAVATTGDDEFYDSDDYDADALPSSKKTPAGDSWGRDTAKDDWVQKKTTPASDEGRMMSAAEARARLKQMDEMTTKAQGWMRGKDAARRLAAMQSLISAYPKLQEERAEARNPLQMLHDSLWQGRPAQQEEEQMAVRDHLHTTVTAASRYAQSSADKVTVPTIRFMEVWNATDGFDSEALLIQDTYGKIYQAELLGGTHAIRVLDGTKYSPPALNNFLQHAAALRHAHIVTLKGAIPDRGILVHDLPESGNVLYLLQTGEMPNKDPLQWNNCVEIALSVASALQYMHNRREQLPHGALSAANVLVDRNAVAKVSDVGLFALTNSNPPSTDELLVNDLHALGELVLQLLTLNTQPVDADMRRKVVDFVDGGGHIGASSALGWPTDYAKAFEAIAITCFKAGTRGARASTAETLRDDVVPQLQRLEGHTFDRLYKSYGSGGSSGSAPSAPPSQSSQAPQAPAAFRCPLTQEVMIDPVLAADGFVYERAAIEQWLSMGRKVSPMTNERLPHTYLTAQQNLRRSIEGWLRQQDGAGRRAPAFA